MRMRSVVIVSLVITLSYTISVAAKVITVDGDGSADHRTIQKAIDRAASGDIVLVAAGTYNESISFRDGITLQGENRDSTVIRSDKNTVVTIRDVSSGVIDGFTISYTGSEDHVPIWLISSSLTISDNVITGATLSGIEAKDNSSPLIINNIIEGNGQAGIFIHSSSTGRIGQNTIRNNGLNAIAIKNSHVDITHNVIEGNDANGIRIYASSGGRIAQNVIEDNESSGIRINENSHPDITNNVIINHKGEFGDGISVGSGEGDTSSPKVYNNTIIGNRIGIGSVGLSGFEVINNIIVNNTYGIGLFSNAEGEVDPILEYNNVWNNSGSNYLRVDAGPTDISENPLFVDEANGDYYLRDMSPLIGAGKDGVDIGALPFVPIPKSTVDCEGVFALHLDHGLNMVSLPNKPSTPMKARGFADRLGATIVIRVNTGEAGIADSLFEPFPLTGGITDPNEDGFEIRGGEGYIVNVDRPTDVAFTGTVWRDAAPPRMALAIIPQPIWAFIVGGRVHEADGVHLTDKELIVQVKNNRSGTVVMGRVGELGQGRFAVTFVDLSRRSVVELGDEVEVSVMDMSGELVAGPIRHLIKQVDLQNAHAAVAIRLGEMTPLQTALGQNFPNPFNPETWIPFQLQTGTDVAIRIYDVTGQLVRVLDLGYKDAGFYHTRNRAAYWDGRNETGERVASGVYFYSMQVGNLKATKKLVVAM